MIQITCALARQLRTVFRKALSPAALRGSPVPVVFHADQDGLHIRIQHEEIAVAYQQPGSCEAERVLSPLHVLDDVEGRQETLVALETTESDTIQARWDDGGVPQLKDYPVQDGTPLQPFPEAPAQFSPLEPDVRKALDEAAQITGESPRYATDRLQLRGSAKEIVATDGRQLLVHGGFSFPWKEDLLVPAIGAFACREIASDAPVSVGKTDTHVCLRIGPWSFFMASDTQGRFPEVDKVVPARNGPFTIWKLSEPDALFLAKVLPRLPGRETQCAPVTVDLNGRVAIRAHGEGQPRSTEVVLQQSQMERGPVCFVTDRHYLARALDLGFREVCIRNPDAPVVCWKGPHTFLWQPLGTNSALPASADAVRITTPGNDPARPQPIPSRRKAMASSQSNGSASPHGAVPTNGASARPETPEASPASGPIAEAVALKETLHQAYGCASRLVAALRRQRKQSRLVANTLASLRELQHIGG